jgi:hypothetical protein
LMNHNMEQAQRRSYQSANLLNSHARTADRPGPLGPDALEKKLLTTEI